MQQEQPSRVGRRLAAIVAADVAGYSRLMGLDEVGTARTLREHRKVTDALVEKHGGRLVKSTGDGSRRTTLGSTGCEVERLVEGAYWAAKCGSA
jgi:class 3 adenylate cyclase